jgi:hypothetical protein
MRDKAPNIVIAFLLFCLGVAVPVAQGQGPCNLATFTGTYAFFDRGSSSIFDANSQPYPLHWAGAYAPFVTVGEVTMGPGGVGDGFYWIRLGSLNGGSSPIPVQVTITEMNEDCTGKFSYQLNLPGVSGATTVTERFMLIDNGREFRSIPADIENGVSTLTWIGEGHRISRPGEALNTCGPQTANGSYLQPVENLTQFSSDVPIFSGAVLLHYNVSISGDFTGTLYEKLGPTGNLVFPFSGTIVVNPDCSYASSIYVNVYGTPVTIATRGLFFDQGKKLYGLQVSSGGTQYSFGQGVRVGQ